MLTINRYYVVHNPIILLYILFIFNKIKFTYYYSSMIFVMKTMSIYMIK